MQFKDLTTQNYTNNYIQFRGNKNIKVEISEKGLLKEAVTEAQEAQPKTPESKVQQRMMQVRLQIS